jgi:glycine dehydrogenase subunit 2
MRDTNKLLKEDFHAMRWHEPIIMDLGTPGERGVLPPAAEEEVKQAVGPAESILPAELLRGDLPKWPEVSQPQVVRHFLRLSQETMGCDVNIDLGLGTCTMKYSPKVNEVLARGPKMADVHPWQDEETMQGLLEIVYRFSKILSEISGMDEFTFQPGGGAQGIFTNACMIRAFHEANGEAKQRDEIITTMFSHPVDAATPAVAGYHLVTLYPDENGYPDLEALKAAVGPRTAAIQMTNPEDTGIFNPRVKEYTDLVHSVGGLCSIDQANANGILGITRARDLGFDMCHFNLHKTFSAPHGSMGPACGAVGVRKDLARFLPKPTVGYDGSKYFLNYDIPDSIGKVRGFFGNLEVVLKSYAWAMTMGPDGIKTAAQTAVLNNNYLANLLAQVRGVEIMYAEGKRRLQEVRYSWEPLKEETGVTTDDIARRVVDFGVDNYFTSHVPWVVPQPFTLEPAESYSKEDLDEYVAIIRRVSDEAYSNPDIVTSAPHRSSCTLMNEAKLTHPNNVFTTWRAWQKRQS